MSAELAGYYRNTRQRVSALALDLSPEELAAPCPATPGWTVQDVLAHVVSNPEDGLAGRLAGGPPSPEQTAAQVERWRGRPVADLVAAWAEVGPAMDQVVEAAGDGIAPLIMDAVTHEQDIRGALGRRGARDTPEMAWAVARVPSFAGGRFDGAGLPAVTFETPAGPLVAGSGLDGPHVRVDGFELLRAALGRRSRAQVASWPWSADPSAHLDVLFVFGPRDGDLVE